jgi:hypothetical protein
MDMNYVVIIKKCFDLVWIALKYLLGNLVHENTTNVPIIWFMRTLQMSPQFGSWEHYKCPHNLVHENTTNVPTIWFMRTLQMSPQCGSWEHYKCSHNLVHENATNVTTIWFMRTLQMLPQFGSWEHYKCSHNFHAKKTSVSIKYKNSNVFFQKTETGESLRWGPPGVTSLNRDVYAKFSHMRQNLASTLAAGLESIPCSR